MKKAGLLREVSAGAFKKDWNVASRPVGTGVPALRDLSAYVFRTAVSDKRTVSVGGTRSSSPTPARRPEARSS